MGTPRDIAKKLDDEELFNLYYVIMGKAGSIPKVHAWLQREKGIYVTQSAVWQSIKRHLARNYENPKIKKIMQDYYAAYGSFLDDEKYKFMVSKHARTCFAVKQYKNWILQHPDLPDLRKDKDK